jgi:hypothetical protein
LATSRAEAAVPHSTTESNIVWKRSPIELAFLTNSKLLKGLLPQSPGSLL